MGYNIISINDKLPLKLSLKIFFIKQNGHLLDVRFYFIDLSIQT